MGASPSTAHDVAKVCTIVAAAPSVGSLDGNKHKASTCTGTQVSVWPYFSAQ